MTVTLDHSTGSQTLGIISRTIRMSEYSFPISSNLLVDVANSDLESLFELGLCALSAKRYGYAKTIFQKAFERNHPLALKYLEITLVKIKGD